MKYPQSHFRVVLAVVLCLLAVSLAGCGDDDDPVQSPEEPPTEYGSVRELVEGFASAYESKNLQAYLNCLDPDFRFILHPDTQARYPDLGPYLDFGQEDRIHGRMFSGEAVADPEGNPQPGVQGIVFNNLLALDSTQPTDDQDNFPGALWAPYDVELLVDCGAAFTTYRAQGRLKIYVRKYIRMSGGKEVEYYLLAGMVDMTDSGKGVENTPWGLIKVFYR
jgi:hypothetical protein